MADGSDEKHGMSDEYVDPYCDICFETKGLNVTVYGYCKDCFQFLCSDCQIPHGKFQVTKDHVILQGSSMPQCQADKPPKFHHCDDHPALVKDQFCCEHKRMICSSCSSDHPNCVVQSIGDVCKNISSSETDSFYNTVKDLQIQAISVLMSVKTNIKKVKEQRKSMLNEIETFYNKIISKVNILFQNMQSDIEAKYQSQVSLLFQHQEKINAMIAKLQFSVTSTEKFQGRPVDTKLFLKIQENVNDINQITGEFKSLDKSMLFVNLSFIPSKILEEFLSTSFTLGSVSKSRTKPYTHIMANDLVFPSTIQPTKLAAPIQQVSGHIQGGNGLPTRPVSKKKDVKLTRPVLQMNAAKQCSYRVKMKQDKTTCRITDMAITEDGRILMADYNNSTVKMFSYDMEFLSSVSVLRRPWYMLWSFDSAPLTIAVISDREAAVTTTNHKLVLLDISGTQLHIKATTQLPYSIRGITSYNDKLVISSDSPTPSVKLIDLTGKVHWSVPSDKQGTLLFRFPWYLASNKQEKSSTVTVTDCGNKRLTLLNGKTSDVITRRHVHGRGPRGVTTDTDGNIYVCYHCTHEVSVLSGDLSEEKILLSGLCWGPQSIVCNRKTQQLLISYGSNDNVDSFKLS